MQKDNCTTKCISTVIMLWEKQYTMGRSMPKPGRLFSFSSSWNMNKPLFHRLFQIHFLELPEYRLPRFLSFPSFFWFCKLSNFDASPVVFKRGLFPLSIHPEQISAQITQREGRCWNQVGLVVWRYVCPRCITANHQTTIMPHTLCQFHFYITYAYAGITALSNFFQVGTQCVLCMLDSCSVAKCWQTIKTFHFKIPKSFTMIYQTQRESHQHFIPFCSLGAI